MVLSSSLQDYGLSSSSNRPEAEFEWMLANGDADMCGAGPLANAVPSNALLLKISRSPDLLCIASVIYIRIKGGHILSSTELSL